MGRRKGVSPDAGASSGVAKTRRELMEELEALRRRVARTEAIEKRLAEMERDLRLLSAAADQTTEGIAVTDLHGNLLYVNEAFARLHGYRPEELAGKHFSIFHLPHQMEAILEAHRLLKSKGEHRGEIMHVRRDGTTFRALMKNYLLRDPEGRPMAVMGTLRDVSRHRLAEQALEDTEAQFRTLVEQLPAITYLAELDETSTALYVSPQIQTLLGYAPEEFIGNPTAWIDRVHPEDRPQVLEGLRRILQSQEPLSDEYRMIARDGREVWFQDRAVVVRDRQGRPLFLQGILLDITQRKKAEGSLRESEERFRDLFEGALEAVFLSHPETGRILAANPAAAELLGRPLETIPGRPLWEIHPPRDRRRSRASFRTFAREEGPHRPLEAAVVRPDGSERVVEMRAQLIQIQGCRVLYSVLHDITERKRAEERMKKNEERYQCLFDECPMPIWELDLSAVRAHLDALQRGGVTDLRRYLLEHREEALRCLRLTRILDVNQANIQLHHAADKEDLARNLEKALGGEPPANLVERLVSVAEGKTTFEGETTIRTFSGEERTVYIKSSVVPGHETDFSRVLVSVLDITTRKRSEEEFAEIQRLESLGLLAGGIAHDFNNLLTSILTNIAMARMYGELAPDISAMLADAERASLQAKNLTQQLLTFAKGDLPVKKPVEVGALLRETAHFALSGSNVRCEYAIEEDVSPISADQGQVVQVIHNLVINADQAMPTGGTLHLSAENVFLAQPDGLPLPPGRYVKITVKDQGVGIPREHLGRVFDPYFTTKQRGSGLGLATAFKIVKNHEGHIRIASEVDRGTTVEVYLPASDGKGKAAARGPRGRRGGTRILLIDDEEMIRKSAGEMLRRLGHEVDFAEDGEEGIAKYRKAMEEGRPFGAVIMDLTIRGGTGGKEAIHRLLRIDPDARVIVSSGYSDAPVLARFRDFGFRGRISKPYTIEEVVDALEKVLDHEPA